MLLLRYSTAITCAVFIIIGAVSGDGMKKAVGETVSFRPDTLESPVTSITWKQKTSLATVKAIEWDVEDGVSTPNPRFKDITTLNKETGQITITNLKIEHSGTYTIDINSKEQGQTFSLEVMERVTKPEITIEESSNPDVVYLRCAYNETIIWKNSAGETLKGMKNHTPGEFITVKNTGNPENYYTCTLKNAVSEKISDQVTERKLFVTDSVPWWIALVVVIPIFIVILLVLLYKFWPRFQKYVNNNLKDKPHIGDGDKPEGATYSSVPLRENSDGGEKDDKL